MAKRTLFLILNEKNSIRERPYWLRREGGWDPRVCRNSFAYSPKLAKRGGDVRAGRGEEWCIRGETTK